jgi:hypothetical protein
VAKKGSKEITKVSKAYSVVLKMFCIFLHLGPPSDTDQGGEESMDIVILPRYGKGDKNMSNGNEQDLF